MLLHLPHNRKASASCLIACSQLEGYLATANRLCQSHPGHPDTCFNQQLTHPVHTHVWRMHYQQHYHTCLAGTSPHRAGRNPQPCVHPSSPTRRNTITNTERTSNTATGKARHEHHAHCTRHRSRSYFQCSWEVSSEKRYASNVESDFRRGISDSLEDFQRRREVFLIAFDNAFVPKARHLQLCSHPEYPVLYEDSSGSNQPAGWYASNLQIQNPG